MKYVYILESLSESGRYYVRITAELKSRFRSHNDGEVPHTSKYAPWKINNYFAFESDKMAYEFEKYLKSGSGRTFSKRHF